MENQEEEIRRLQEIIRIGTQDGGRYMSTLSACIDSIRTYNEQVVLLMSPTEGNYGHTLRSISDETMADISSTTDVTVDKIENCRTQISNYISCLHF